MITNFKIFERFDYEEKWYTDLLENEGIYKVVVIPKNEIFYLKKEVDFLKRLHINFKVFDSDKYPGYYFIISKDSPKYSYTEKSLDDYNNEIDYNLLITADKYNI